MDATVARSGPSPGHRRRRHARADPARNGDRALIGIALAAVAIAIPALGFTLWPIVRDRGGARTFLPLPPDAREQLLEQKRRVLRALRELDFEHEAGHVSDEDHAQLRARYESEAADVLTELDRLGAPAPPRAARAAPAPRRSAWQHPAAVAVTGVALIAFGVALGTGLSRHATTEAPGGSTGGTMDLGAVTGGAGPSLPGRPPTAGGPISPEVKQRMLEAARQSLFEGNYTAAIAAYEAVLKRDPKSVDAITHLGLIVALGGHTDDALRTFDRALALDPNYAPALLYRGQVLYEAKNDAAGAIRSWEKYVQVAPPGEDRDRVVKMIADAKVKRPPAPEGQLR